MLQHTRMGALVVTAALLVVGAGAGCSSTKTPVSVAGDRIPSTPTGQVWEQAGQVSEQVSAPIAGDGAATASSPDGAVGPARVATEAITPVVHAVVATGHQPARAQAAAPSPPPSSSGTSWAVLVGISHYQGNTEPTYGGDGDVAAFQRLLQQAGWDPSHILVVTDGAATASGIRDAMRWLVSHSSPNSFTLFHYSGHVCKEGRGPCRGPEKYLWPSDNALISDLEFGQIMSGLQGWSWIDIAGCEAGAFDERLSGPQRFFTGSSLASETSYEYPPWHESVWTGMLVDQGMLQGGAAQGSGPISLQQAVTWAKQQVTNMTSGQSAGAQHPYANGGVGDWFLGSPAPAQQGGQPPPAPPPPDPGSPPGPGSPPSPSPPPRCSILGIINC